MPDLAIPPEERPFLDAILANPDDDEPRLVYADWLEERGDQRAEWLRAEVAYFGCDVWARRERKALHFSLRRARDTTDLDWVAALARTRIENCPDARERQRLESMSDDEFDAEFEMRAQLREQYGLTMRPLPRTCTARWEHLKGSDRVRRCNVCQVMVHYCEDLSEARRHVARGRIVAVDLAAARLEREHDLTQGGSSRSVRRDLHPNEDFPTYESDQRLDRLRELQ